MNSNNPTVVRTPTSDVTVHKVSERLKGQNLLKLLRSSTKFQEKVLVARPSCRSISKCTPFKGNYDRKAELIGKTVTGTIGAQVGKCYFIWWNKNRNDNVFVKTEIVEAVLGKEVKKGTPVRCTIDSMGPSRIPISQQHPISHAIEKIPRSSMTPKCEKLCKSAYWRSYQCERYSGSWKKSEKLEVCSQINAALDAPRDTPAFPRSSWRRDTLKVCSQGDAASDTPRDTPSFRRPRDPRAIPSGASWRRPRDQKTPEKAISKKPEKVISRKWRVAKTKLRSACCETWRRKSVHRSL